MKKINTKKFARVLVDAVERKTANEMEEIVSEFVAYLSQCRLLASWREIVRGIELVWKEKYGAANVSIISAHPLSKKFRDALAEIAPCAEIDETIDPEIIGGAIIRIDDRIIDGSVVGQLDNLKLALIK